MHKLASVLVLFFAFLAPSFADPADDFVERYIQKKQIPGLALLVVQDGKIVRAQGYGMANLEHSVPVKPQTVFQSGSVGKQFTATAVMMLAEEGKLSVDDPISKYLDVPDSWKAITIRHLLSHTSGLGDYPEDFDLQKDHTEEEVFAMVRRQPLGFAAGDKWTYSNLGYITLGVLIRKVSGKFYGDFLQERVFQPLGMKSTRIITEADLVPHRAAGYRLEKGVIKNQEWVAPMVNTTADGSLYFTIEDLAKWDAALNTETLLKKASLEMMWTPVTLNSGKKTTYGFGWGIQKTREGKRLIEHGGAWQGFSTHISRYPDDGITVVALCNMQGASPDYVVHRVAGFYKKELGPVERAMKRVPPEALRSLEGEYRLEDRMTVKVAAKEDRLLASFLGQSVEMLPESEELFFEEDSERTYRFVKDKDGRVQEMILATPEELSFRRIEAAKPCRCQNFLP
jgi:CubicO group peptidase (beta-lactamase class C family)